MRGAVVVCALVLGAVTAHAEEARTPPAVAQLYDRGLAEYLGGRPQKAAGKLHDFLLHVTATHPRYAWAQLYLASALIELGFKHAGATGLAQIARERTDPEVLTRALTLLRSLTDSPHDEAMVDEAVFGSLDVAFLPPDVAAYAHYQQGLMDLRLGKDAWAQAHFLQLGEGSKESYRSRYVQVVQRLKSSEKAPESVLKAFQTLAQDPKAPGPLRIDAQAAVARLQFERGDYRAALNSYRAIELPPLAPGRAALYVEEAWTRYYLHDFSGAMGVLTALDAPSFRDELIPDKSVLRALIYRDLCHFLPAKRAARALTLRYARSLQAIEGREDLTEDARLRRAAETHGATQRAARFHRTLQKESDALGAYAGDFGAGLYDQLERVYGLSLAEAQRNLDSKLQASVEEEANRLVLASEQVRLIEDEVSLKLYARTRPEPEDEDLKAPRVEAAPVPRPVEYVFSGEFWNDELRSYEFRLTNRCAQVSP